MLHYFAFVCLPCIPDIAPENNNVDSAVVKNKFFS